MIEEEEGYEEEFEEEPVPQPKPRPASQVRYERPPEEHYYEPMDMALLAPNPELVSAIGGGDREQTPQQPRKRVNSNPLDDSAFRQIMGGW